MNPMCMGKAITPNGINQLGTDRQIARGPSRVRADGLGNNIDYGNPVAIAE